MLKKEKKAGISEAAYDIPYYGMSDDGKLGFLSPSSFP